MGIKTALRTRLLAVTAVTDEVSTRVYQDWAPQGSTFPYITFQQLTSIGHGHTGAASAIAETEFQIDCWARTTASREAVAEAVRNALDGFRQTTVSSVYISRIYMTDKGSDTTETVAIAGQELPVYRSRLEIRVWHAQAVPTL